MTESFVQVAVEAPLPFPLTYRLPKEFLTQAAPGVRVKVPLGKGRSTKGVILGESTDTSGGQYEIKNVSAIMNEPLIGEKTLKWLKWLSQYYLHPPGQVYALSFAPADEKRKKKSNKISPTHFDFPIKATVFDPNPAQKAAIDSIVDAVTKESYETFLLYGITGSGKTEVYLRSIEQTLLLNKQALVLVPEISLTPQLIKRFVERFGDKVAVIHSHLTARERADQWWSAVKGEKKILIGARSALFCPLENLGLIIVDEEHESSFKQEEQLKYNARDAAIMRAQISRCPIVLGSATPSLESWYNVTLKKYTLLSLPQRVENRPLPEVVIVDMREEKKARSKDMSVARPYWMSELLYKELLLTLENKEQSALFLNRRGFAQFIMCESCGFTEPCPHCSVTLTVHKKGTRLECHYCGFQKAVFPSCPSCKTPGYKPIGLGTEKVAEDLQLLLPLARIARADRDEINSRETLEDLLNKINNHEIDIIVGTQMIAKGHDFPNLTFVGAVLADVGLHLPDFRSSERTFQLLTQVAGRAGRHQKKGRVIIQTYIPEHPAIRAAVKHDYEMFAKEEIIQRQELQYPPFGRIASVRLQSLDLEKVEKAADDAKLRILSLQKIKPEYASLEVLGPCEAPLAKVRGKYRFHLMIKTTSSKTMNNFLQHLMQNLDWVESGVKLSIDVDPLQLL
jgi:primosomal protein N' (replication factor Y)